jgi:type IV pilus assembly protein PilC
LLNSEQKGVYSICPISVSEENIKSVLNRWWRYRKVSRKELSLFCRQLSVMINSGVPLLSSLAVLRDQAENSTLKDAFSGIHSMLEDGNSLSQALSYYPNEFPGILISMVSAGEAGGVLEEILGRIADFFEWEHRVREKVKASITYPAVVFCVAVLAVGFIVAFFVPVFSRILVQMNVEVPLITRILFFISEVLRNFWFVIIAGAGAGIWGVCRFAKRSLRVRKIIDTLYLKMPIIGNMVRKTVIARFCRTVATLLRVGVPLVKALELAEKTSGNIIVEESIAQARKSILDGEGMAEPLKKSCVFTPLVLEMIVVGEETGSLTAMLDKAADIYDEEVDNLSSRITTLIEPALVVFVGAIVCVVLLSVFLPMFKVLGSVG